MSDERERSYMEQWAILRLCDYEIDALEHIISYYDPREVPKRLLNLRKNLERAPRPEKEIREDHQKLLNEVQELASDPISNIDKIRTRMGAILAREKDFPYLQGGRKQWTRHLSEEKKEKED